MIKPLFSNVLVKPQEKDTQTKSGIFIPDNVNEEKLIGEILAVGVDVTAVKMGDKVLYTKWGGNEVEYQGKDYLLIQEKDLLCIYND